MQMLYMVYKSEYGNDKSTELPVTEVLTKRSFEHLKLF
jgi:hypothetical protein